MVHKHDLGLPIVLRLDFALTGIDLMDFTALPLSELSDRLSLDANSAWIQLTVRWSEQLSEPVQADYEVGINGRPFARGETNPVDAASHTVQVNRNHPWLGADNAEDDTFSTRGTSEPDAASSADPDVVWEVVPPIEADLVRRPARMESIFDELLYVLQAHDFGELHEAVTFGMVAPGEYLLSVLKTLRYLGPIREIPERNYSLALSPEESRWSNGLAAWDWLVTARAEQIDELNAWLTREDRLGTGYRVEVKRFKELDTEEMLYLELMQGTDLLDNLATMRKGLEALPAKTKIILRQERDYLPVMPQDVGIGISQLIPVVVSAVDTHDRITVIEQPELHIHPAIQVGLGDLFISKTQGEEGADRIFLIETHSEHLLLRLLRRIRESNEGRPTLQLNASNLAVYYVEANESGTDVRRLRVTDEGRFADRWPQGFFEEREKEFFGDQEDVQEELKKSFPQ
jgi:hypothetical protein